VEALGLNPDDYRGTYKLIGGRLSLDFVNTVSWPDSARRHEWLSSVGNVVLWLNAVGLTVTNLAKSDLVSIYTLRTTLTAVLRPLAHGKRPGRQAIEHLNEYVSASNARRVIAPIAFAWTWQRPKCALDVFGPVVLDAADLITGRGRDRLRYCPSCDWLFEDQSRNGKRRWCDMADCGSRDKSHRYYERNK
jgi:predicted RNA-binding Zn ribbon-like protein